MMASANFQFTLNLTFLLGLVTVFNASATVLSQDKKLSIQVENVQLRDLFREIEDNSEYSFFFNDQYAQLDKKVSLLTRDEKIENVQRKEHDGKIKESVVFHSKPWGWFMLCLNE